MFERFRKRRASGTRLAVCPGTQGIAVAALARAPGEAPTLAWAAYLPGGNDPAPWRAALVDLLRRHQAEACPATSVLPSAAYNLLLIETPTVPAAELREAVRWKVKDLIDFDVEDAVIDVFPVPPMKGGRDHMAYAVVSRRSVLREFIDAIEAADIALATIDIPELALRNLTAHLPEDAGGVVFVHLEEQHGLVIVTRQRQLFLSRRFEVGRARLLAAADGSVTAAVEGLLDAIVIEIQRSLDFYESQYAQPPVQALVVAPLGQPLAGLPEYLSSQLGLPTRVLELDALLDSVEVPDRAIVPYCLTAIGAALRDEAVAA